MTDAAVPMPAVSGGRLRALMVLALAMLAGMVARTLLSPVQELAKADMGLSDNQMGLIQGMALALPVAVLAVPIGRLVDRTRRVTLLLALSALWISGTVLSGLAWDFASLFVGRMLVGLGAAGAVPAILSLTADLSTPERRGRAVMVMVIGQAAGMAAAFAGGGALVGTLAPVAGLPLGLTAWRATMLLVALMMLAPTALLVWQAEPARQEGTTDARPEVPPRLGPALAELWRLRRLVAPLMAGMITVNMGDAAATVWAVPVLTRSFGLQPADFGGWMGVLLGLSGAGGTVLGGLVADWGHKRNAKGGILWGALGGAALSVPAALFALAPGVPLFALLLALLMVAGAIVAVGVASAITLLVPNHLRGLCLGLMSALGVFISLGLAPSIVSLLAQAFGGEEHLPLALALEGAVASLVGVLTFRRALRAARS
ncbi:MFS transporter [Nitrospirillum viridazoti]|uniref:MFS family arabinose efflux permease n=1 Tax=Nitrospirillum amazonense TaxID=28077 RepID=A0A560IR34_9PROT|nr:MFS transporter [Nitrospirillum amazonense]TWB60559.1 putative MFS family arabinose efflux permease [Nitrospirillum amazonense]